MKIDQQSPKKTVNLTPTSEELAARPPQGPQKVAQGYSERVIAKKRQIEAIKDKGQPLGGAPPIPPGKLAGLGQQPPEETGEEAPPDYRATLPPVQGVGAAYAVNQAMARGDARGGPISLREAKSRGLGGVERPPKPLSDKSIEALKRANESAEQEDKEALPTDGMNIEEKFVAAAKDDSTTAAKLPFDINEFIQAQDSLSSRERRKTIEDRLEELKIEDLIASRGLQQKVVIIPDKYYMALRTFPQREYLWILSYAYEFPGPPRYSEALLDTFKMVLSLVSVNGALIPDHRVKIGTPEEDVDREAFKRKMFYVASYPVQLMADFAVQCNWFDERVKKLFTFEQVKNG